MRIRYVLIVIALSIALANILADWMMGCGEHYRDSQGTVHIEQCYPKGVF
jgi:hypothetical protein